MDTGSVCSSCCLLFGRHLDRHPGPQEHWCQAMGEDPLVDQPDSLPGVGDICCMLELLLPRFPRDRLASVLPSSLGNKEWVGAVPEKNMHLQVDGKFKIYCPPPPGNVVTPIRLQAGCNFVTIHYGKFRPPFHRISGKFTKYNLPPSSGGKEWIAVHPRGCSLFWNTLRSALLCHRSPMRFHDLKVRALPF